MEPKNLLVIMSDEHRASMLGCYGNRVVRTPHLDELAIQGTRFSSAYCTSPVCIPARAGFATGRYHHQIGYWDNADPYDGRVPSWHHYVRDMGANVTSIGKLHFRSDKDDNGFSEEILPMHVVEEKGDLMGLVRDGQIPERKGAWKMADMAGPGESMYTRYDRDIAEQAQIWLNNKASNGVDRPWVLFVSFVSPHFPLTAPSEYYYEYYNNPDLPWPKQYAEDERPDHPYLKEYGDSFAYDKYFDSEEKIRSAVAGYYGLCTFLDEQIGKVVTTLDRLGLRDDTRILYTSDHGDNLGARGVWGKSTMYDDAAAIPLIVAGKGIPENHVVKSHVSHVDVFPFVLESTGAKRDDVDESTDRPGVSLASIANGYRSERSVLCEYHGMGSSGAIFMVRYGRFKYIHYVNYPPQLFDLETDPEELTDLATNPDFRSALEEGRRLLYEHLDPDEVDQRAKKRQKELLEVNGGRDAVISRGDLGFSVPPGVEPNFDS